MILGLLLLGAWLWGVWERDRRAYFMRDWVHVLFVASVIVLLMAVGAAIRG